MSYCEIVSRSCFSLLEGASTPEELLEAASLLGISSLCIADRDAVYGLVRAHKAAKKFGVHLICGATITVNEHPPLTLVVETTNGWRNLCRLLTLSRREHPKGYASTSLDNLFSHSEGLTVLVHYGWTEASLTELSVCFRGHICVLLTRHLSSEDEEYTNWALEMSQRFQWPVVASNHPVAHVRERKQIADVLTCIRLGIRLDDAGCHVSSNDERVLLSEKAFTDRFSDIPIAVQNAKEIAQRCTFSLDSLTYTYPQEVVPDGYSPMEWLTSCVHRGLSMRYPEGVPDVVRKQVRHELQLIEKLDFPHYFLTVYDVVQFARAQGILCQGRGSAANSAVCYALGITAVDPSCARLLFERFISEERGEPPDIDVDFEHERREEVIQYIYRRYGRHRAALINEFVTYRFRSALRDVGKVFGLSLDQVDRLAKTAHGWGVEWDEEAFVTESGLDPTDWSVQQTIAISRALKGFPRHLSIHVGGFVISNQPLIDLVPVEPANMTERTVIQWDKDDVDALGFVKVDVLGLGILTMVRKGLDLIRKHRGVSYSLATVPPEDSRVYDMFCRADTVGVFQIESRAQMSMLPRLRPRCFYDLVIEVSIVRPGPIQGGMVHPYLRRRRGEESVFYAHPALKTILERTLGVPLFQEQVMQMAVAIGGFSPGEADELRRAMGAWRKRGTLEGMGRKLVVAMKDNGLSQQYAESIFKQIKGFGEYGFPESHAASFALLVYVSGWLKCHYPAAFAAALINSQPMGFYSPRSIVSDAERHGVLVQPVCVQCSFWDCTLEEMKDGALALRLGFRLIKKVSEEDAIRIVDAREQTAFTDVTDFCSRVGLSRRILEILATANAFHEMEKDRREALWQIQGQWTQLPLFSNVARKEPSPVFPPETIRQRVVKDYNTVGLSVSLHPMSVVRKALGPRVRTLRSLWMLNDGDQVSIAGLVINRQRPQTANGVVFMTLEDEGGLVNVVVWPSLWQKQRQLARTSALLGVHGLLQKEGTTISVVAKVFWPIKGQNMALGSCSRDFQ